MGAAIRFGNLLGEEIAHPLGVQQLVEFFRGAPPKPHVFPLRTKRKDGAWRWTPHSFNTIISSRVTKVRRSLRVCDRQARCRLCDALSFRFFCSRLDGSLAYAPAD